MDIKTSLFSFPALGELHPGGWLKRQLEIQAAGLCGKLDTFWPDIKDSAWIGGEAEGWERLPYWLDGLIPLAWLLDDEALKEKATKYVDAILAAQAGDGWICPGADRRSYDMWAYFLVLKVLSCYDRATQDPRILPAIERALRCLDRHLDRHTLFGWGAMRWFECLIPILWLYKRQPESWLIELAHKLHAQGFDWPAFVLSDDYPYKNPCEKDRWSFYNHVVNCAMMIKSAALYTHFDGERQSISDSVAMYEKLMYYHGSITGIFTGDENLNGHSAAQGTELCAIAELMYSAEHMVAVSGDPYWADLMELLAFNAWPATFTEDMEYHQYVQQVNQPSCLPLSPSPFSTNGSEAHLFGVEPNYGCCTANFAQGWPKFAGSVFMRTESGFTITTPVPMTLKSVWDGIDVEIHIDSDYPFGDSARIEIITSEPVEFELRVHIHGGGFNGFKQMWQGKTSLVLSATPKAELRKRPDGKRVLLRGPVIYALPIEARAEMQDKDVGDKPWLNNMMLHPLESYDDITFCRDAADNLTFMHHGISEHPFSQEHPPISVKVPCMGADKKRRYLQFVPYGCTMLRMTEI